jgi:hypothetical protein
MDSYQLALDYEQDKLHSLDISDFYSGRYKTLSNHIWSEIIHKLKNESNIYGTSDITMGQYIMTWFEARKKISMIFELANIIRDEFLEFVKVR